MPCLQVDISVMNVASLWNVGDLVRREKAVQGPQNPAVLALSISRSELFGDDSFKDNQETR